MSASVGVSTHSEPHDSSRIARAIGNTTSLEALFVCREKRARAELLGRALLATALLERLLRFCGFCFCCFFGLSELLLVTSEPV
jgi:hypothetical protein